MEELQAVRRARKKICTSRRYEYAWLRIDPCIELPEDTEGKVPRVLSSKIANEFIHQAVPFAGRGVEYFAVVCMNTKNEPIAVAIPHKGGRNSSVVDISVVLQAVLLAGAPAFIIAHNHPSQDPAPSTEDVALSKRLKKAAEIVKLQMLDSLVVTDDENVYSSFQDMGLLRE
jgi:DNA repair protein RadC